MSKIKKTSKIVLTALVLLATGCNECRNDDCPPTARFQFQVMDTEGNPLFELTDLSQPLESGEIQIIGLDNSNNQEEIRLWQDGTTLRFDLLSTLDRYIIDYSTAGDDTLNFDIDTYDDNCCSNIPIGYQVEVNSNGHLVSSMMDSIFVFIK